MFISPLSCAVSNDDDNVCFNFPKVPVFSGCEVGVSSVATICKRKKRDIMYFSRLFMNILFYSIYLINLTLYVNLNKID